MNITKRITALLSATALLLSLAACGEASSGPEEETAGPSASAGAVETAGPAEHELFLSDGQITLDGEDISAEDTGPVTVGGEIVYYEAGHGSDYGEGTEADEHTAGEAQSHTLVTIREAGTYRLTGSLSRGQIAVDLGEDAAGEAEATVTLILDNVDVTCTVAPALIFYNVYECGSSDESTASPEVDTSNAGANVIIADGSVNNFTGSYVARIYKEGTTDKLHKYDGAFYSRMSMNVSGGDEGTGVLNIVAENEGLDSELHLTINGGIINITAQNDGINTNEDNVSVTAVNGGTLNIDAGLGSEGDGIDSNGWLVINGGEVYASANAQSGDSGLDASLDILLNGGTVAALGSMLDAVSEDSGQGYLSLMLTESPEDGSVIELSGSGGVLISYTAPKGGQMLLLSAAGLEPDGEYSLTVDGLEAEYRSMETGMGGFPGGMGGEGGRGGFTMDIPEGLESWLETAQDIPDDIRAWLEQLTDMRNSLPEGGFDGMDPSGGGMPPDGAEQPPAGAEQPPDEQGV